MVASAVQPHLPSTSRTTNTASTTNAAQASTQATQPTAAEQQHVSDLQQQFQQQAQKDPAGFRSALRAAFGDKASLARIDQLLDMALAGRLPMPSNIQFVEAGLLGNGALGAYDASNGGSLYLDRSLLSDPTKMQSVFNEEMGHHMDALLGGADAAGDEGAVFSRTLEQGALSQTELTALKNEDDHGVIQIEGRWVQVEFSEEGTEDSGSEDTGGGGEGGEGSGGGGECSVGGGGNTGTDTGESETTSGESSGSGSNETGAECGVDGPPSGGGPPGTGGTQDGSDPPETGSPQGGGDPPGGGGPPGGDNRDDDIGGDPLGGESKPPSEADTESALDGLSKAGTGLSVVDALNQKAGEAMREAQLPDDIKRMNRGAGAFARALGTLTSLVDPVIAAEHERRRAESEGADLGEQLNQAVRAGLKRVDNVAVTAGVTAAGGLSGNPFVAVAAGTGAGHIYSNSAMDNDFDEAVDILADEIESPSTNAQGYVQYASPSQYWPTR